MEKNKMDEKPFLEFDLTDIKDSQIEELKKFHKSYFNIDTILSSASELKFTSELKALLAQEFANPSPELTKYFAKQIYEGTITAKLLEQFTLLTKKTISNYINDLISERLKSAMKQENEEKTTTTEEATAVCAETSVIDTTSEEIEGFMITRAILRQVVDVSRVVFRDAKTYFAILFDDNNRKPICRLYLNGSKRYIVMFDEEKKELKTPIETIDDLYKFADNLISTVNKYLLE